MLKSNPSNFFEVYMHDEEYIGKRIREYEILDILGKGGMGAVYLARHVYLDEQRALKLIHSNLANDSQFKDRFIREARILVKLRHPNLVQLYEFDTVDEEDFFMVMELMRGESVLQRIDRLKRIPVNDAVKIIKEAALGMHSAHQVGVVHRDISPDNILIVKDAEGVEITKVVDFGIAKMPKDTAGQFTMVNMFIGKPEFCSPEQCGSLGEGETIDGRSDIYSLGITMYYMLTGQLPFSSRSPERLIRMHLTEPPHPVSDHFPPGEFPEKLNGIIMKTLAKKREDRQATMAVLANELDQFLGAQTSKTVYPPVSIQSQTGDVELNPGDLWGQRFFIEEKINVGRSGAIYKATDKVLEMRVALKIISSRIFEDPSALERFRRGIVLSRRVAHQNICQIYDMGVLDGMHYVSMEYLEGKTLMDMLNEEKRLTTERGIPILNQILLGLQEIHRSGVIHMNLKPQNIFVVSDRVEIMDFGLSAVLDSSNTATSDMVGTPHYMAPERFESKKIDQRSDIYSIGSLMYQIFTGKLPYQHVTPRQVKKTILVEPPPKPSDIVPGFSAGLESVILKCLARNPEDRYQSAEELRQSLLAIQDSLNIHQHAENIQRQLNYVLQVLNEDRFSDLQSALQSLLLTAQNSFYSQDCELFSKEITALIDDVASYDFESARKRTGLLDQSASILKLSQANWTIFKGKVEEKAKKDQTLETMLFDGVNHFQAKRWKEAIECLDTVDQLSPGNEIILRTLRIAKRKANN